MGQVNFWGSGGIPPAPFPLGETLGIKGTMSLRVSLPQSLSHLAGYENKISRREIYSIDNFFVMMRKFPQELFMSHCIRTVKMLDIF